MAPDTLISLVITTYNRPDALAAVVEACFDQTDRAFEIIIADDGSDESTQACAERLRARSPVPLRHVWQPDQGFRLAMSRNRAILAARGDYILILDGDCIPQRDFIAQHRRLAQPGCMVTGSRILLGQALTARVLQQGLDMRRLGVAALFKLRLGRQINKCAPLWLKLPDRGRVHRGFSYRRIKGCNMGAWRSDLVRVNGFDESFKGWGHEDADLVLRMHHAGVRRKDGAFATEVLHLWHPEARRDHSDGNRAVVLQRERDGTILAARGLDGHTEAARTAG
ncbi:MAG: glycosyltransferase family 2 protein [Gammaproteobacteria bacterium]